MPEASRFAISAWQMMRGLDWAALPIVADVLGVEDVDTLIAQLIVLRDNPELLDG